MRFSWSRLLRGVAAAGFTLLSLAAPAAAQLERLEVIGDWQVFFNRDDSGLLFCGAARPYGSDEWLHVDRMNQTTGLTMTFYSGAAPKLRTGQTVSVELNFDGDRLVLSGSGASTSRLDGVQFIASSELVEKLASSSAMSIRYAGFAGPSLPLSQTAAAVESVRRCVRERF